MLLEINHLEKSFARAFLKKKREPYKMLTLKWTKGNLSPSWVSLAQEKQPS